jgi:hypothetical protein
LHLFEGKISGKGDDYIEIESTVDWTVNPGEDNALPQKGVVAPPIPIWEHTSIRLIPDYGTGTPWNFIDEVVDQAVLANYGNTPFITYADVAGFLQWLPVHLTSLWSNDWAERGYKFFSPVQIIDILKNDFLLFGCAMRLETDGRIGTASVRKPTVSDTSLVSITTDHIVVPPDGKFPVFTPAPDGVVSVVKISRDYSAEVDDYQRPDITVQNIHSISTHKNRSRATMNIEPKSQAVARPIFSPDAIVIANRQFAIHAHDYDTVRLDLTYDMYDTLVCGDGYLITSPHIPNTENGTMGVTATPALCIGRSWPLNPDISMGEGEFILFRDRGSSRGYAPAARITSAVASGGNIWLLTVHTSTFAATSENPLDCFSSSDKVEVIEFNAAAPGTQTGVVSAVTAASDTIRVNFDGAAPWGAAMTAAEVYDIVFQTDGGALNTGQTNYCYVADVDAHLQNGSGGRKFL